MPQNAKNAALANKLQITEDDRQNLSMQLAEETRNRVDAERRASSLERELGAAREQLLELTKYRVRSALLIPLSCLLHVRGSKFFGCA